MRQNTRHCIRYKGCAPPVLVVVKSRVAGRGRLDCHSEGVRPSWQRGGVHISLCIVPLEADEEVLQGFTVNGPGLGLPSCS